ncbi:hypothetical protein QBC41DRAFT_188834, partial [Cercophora samala]
RVALETQRERQQQEAIQADEDREREQQQEEMDSRTAAAAGGNHMHQDLPNQGNEPTSDQSDVDEEPLERASPNVAHQTPTTTNLQPPKRKAPGPLLGDDQAAKRIRKEEPHLAFRHMAVAGGIVAAGLIMDEAFSAHSAFGQPLMPGLAPTKEAVGMYCHKLVNHIMADFGKNIHLNNGERAFTWGAISTLMNLVYTEAQHHGSVLTIPLQRGAMVGPNNAQELVKMGEQMHKTHAKAMKKFKSRQNKTPAPLPEPAAQSMSSGAVRPTPQLSRAANQAQPAPPMPVHGPPLGVNIVAGSRPPQSLSALTRPQAQPAASSLSHGSPLRVRTLTESGSVLPSLQDVDSTASCRKTTPSKVQKPSRSRTVAANGQPQAPVVNGAQAQNYHQQPQGSGLPDRQMGMVALLNLRHMVNLRHRRDTAKHRDMANQRDTAKLRTTINLKPTVKQELKATVRLT